MASVKDHYDKHLARIYEWMTGDFSAGVKQRQVFYDRNKITSSAGAVAIDLGCGHGIDSVSLSGLGYKVIAIDFNKHLLGSLESRNENNSIDIIENDFLEFRKFITTATLIVCMGDTLAHIASIEQIIKLFRDCYGTLDEKGKLVVSFRDYGKSLQDTKRFIPVKADDSRILTCFLEYQDSTVLVTDILHEKEDGNWVQKTSQYTKLRLTGSMVQELLEESGFRVVNREDINGLIYLVAEKTP